MFSVKGAGNTPPTVGRRNVIPDDLEGLVDGSVVVGLFVSEGVGSIVTSGVEAVMLLIESAVVVGAACEDVYTSQSTAIHRCIYIPIVQLSPEYPSLHKHCPGSRQ